MLTVLRKEHVVTCVFYSGKCSPPWENAVHSFAPNYFKRLQPRCWLTYTSTFYLYVFYLV